MPMRTRSSRRSMPFPSSRTSAAASAAAGRGAAAGISLVVMSDDLAFLDATAQADLVRRRQVSPAELTEAAIRRIERLNPTLNAVIHTFFERARAEARHVPSGGAFPGVPFLMKDIL